MAEAGGWRAIRRDRVPVPCWNLAEDSESSSEWRQQSVMFFCLFVLFLKILLATGLETVIVEAESYVGK